MDAELQPLDCSKNDSNLLLVSFLNLTDPQYFYYRKSYISILLILAFCGICLNLSMIVFLVRGLIHQKKAMGCLVLQLLIANFFVSVFCLLVDGIWNATIQWKGGDFPCRILKFLQMFSLYATTLILMGISIESCVTLSYPLTCSNRVGTFLRVRVISTMAWIASAIMSAPQAIIFHVEKAPVCFDFYQCVTHGFYSNHVQELVYTMATLCFMFIVPLVIIIVCHVIIAVKFTSEVKLVSEKISLTSPVSHTDGLSTVLGSNLSIARSTQGIRVYKRSRKRSLLMTSLTAIIFLICWVPYYVTMIAQLFYWKVSQETLSVIFCFGMSYAVLNPIIFGGFVFNRRKDGHESPREFIALTNCQ